MADPTAMIDDAQAEQRPVWLDDHDGKRELRLRSRRRARIAAVLLAAFVAVTVMRWAWVSLDLLTTDGLDAGWSWLRVVQFAIAVPGVIAGVAAFAYLVVLVRHGYAWRRWREVAAAFFGLVLLWSAVYALGVVVF